MTTQKNRWACDTIVCNGNRINQVIWMPTLTNGMYPVGVPYDFKNPTKPSYIFECCDSCLETYNDELTRQYWTLQIVKNTKKTRVKKIKIPKLKDSFNVRL